MRDMPLLSTAETIACIAGGHTLSFRHALCVGAGCPESLYWLDGYVYHGRNPEARRVAEVGKPLRVWLVLCHEPRWTVNPAVWIR